MRRVTVTRTDPRIGLSVEAGITDAIYITVGRASAYCVLTFPRMSVRRADTRIRCRGRRDNVATFMLDRWPFGGIQEIATMRSLLGRWAAKKRGALEVDVAEP